MTRQVVRLINETSGAGCHLSGALEMGETQVRLHDFHTELASTRTNVKEAGVICGVSDPKPPGKRAHQ